MHKTNTVPTNVHMVALWLSVDRPQKFPYARVLCPCLPPPRERGGIHIAVRGQVPGGPHCAGGDAGVAHRAHRRGGRLPRRLRGRPRSGCAHRKGRDARPWIGHLANQGNPVAVVAPSSSSALPPPQTGRRTCRRSTAATLGRQVWVPGIQTGIRAVAGADGASAEPPEEGGGGGGGGGSTVALKYLSLKDGTLTISSVAPPHAHP